MPLTDTQSRLYRPYVGESARAPHDAELQPLIVSLGYLVFAERMNGEEPPLERILESARAKAILPWADDLTPESFQQVFAVYARVLRAVQALETRLEELKRETGLDQLEIELSLGTWKANPARSPTWFADFVEMSRTSEALPELTPEEQLPNAVEELLNREPLGIVPAPQPSEPPFNSDPTRRKIPAPPEVLDAESRIALYGTDKINVNVQEDFAGTGGIRKITARRNPDASLEVEIEGEILPGRLPRKPSTKKGEPAPVPAPGQSWAPDLQSAGFRKLVELPLRDPGQWERLHLWGPGFGDEAGAGIFLGPERVNQVYQNRGIETLIRHLGRLVVPLREHGYRLHCSASVTTWPDPTDAGFRLERVFRSATYIVTLTYPDPSDRSPRKASAQAGLELRNDPFYIDAGKEAPDVRLSADTTAWTELFALIPNELPDHPA